MSAIYPGQSKHPINALHGDHGSPSVSPIETMQLRLGLKPTVLFFVSPSFYLFYYSWLPWVFIAAPGLLIAVASLVAEHRLQGAQASVVAAHGFNCPVAFQHVGSFQTRDQNLCPLQ